MNDNKLIAGIDVGNSGCLSLCEVKDGNIVSDILTFKPSRWIEVLSELVIGNDLIVYVERLWARPGQSSHSAGKMMQNYGETIGILKALKIKYVEITPMVWQKGIGHIAPKGTDYKDRKALLVIRAKEDYPDIGVFQWMADGLLIMQFGIKIEKEKEDE